MGICNVLTFTSLACIEIYDMAPDPATEAAANTGRQTLERSTIHCAAGRSRDLVSCLQIRSPGFQVIFCHQYEVNREKFGA